MGGDNVSRDFVCLGLCVLKQCVWLNCVCAQNVYKLGLCMCEDLLCADTVFVR